MAEAFAQSVAERKAAVDGQDDPDAAKAAASIEELFAKGKPESEKLNDLARLQGEMTKMGIRDNKHTDYTLPALNVLRKNFARHVRNRLAALNDERDLKAEYESGAKELVQWWTPRCPSCRASRLTTTRWLVRAKRARTGPNTSA